MGERLQKLFDRVESRIALGQIVWGSGVIGFGITSGTLSGGVAWIDQFGAFGWWVSFLVGCLLASAILALVGWFRFKYEQAKLLNKAARERTFDVVNPLDLEFHKRRIEFSAIGHPLTGNVSNKVFSDCELIGPANILALGNTKFYETSFEDCDWILIREDAIITNVKILENCTFTRGRVVKGTIYVHPKNLEGFKDGIKGVIFVNRTGDADLDNRRRKDTVVEILR